MKRFPRFEDNLSTLPRRKVVLLGVSLATLGLALVAISFIALTAT